MPLRASSIQAGFEPIPGYVLRNKLGAGGYGEVWLADAPGGLKKAIKFVHGNIDGNRASSELKSLQRVRQVNHPFILSLERIEVIDGQLIIVTELAQGSLHDRYVEFRQKGFVGIARERLIGYMRDTADGLDFLCQHHDLQHLDVKPANLLLVADRVKVADFGLIKDIQSNSLSVMGGLTPTYAAPEMFDGRPGRFSDQYSLAIVYQELLTGTLPFRGRTTAQLANEHLHKAPNLEAIPLLERPILSKALSKKPQMRFNDCREFVNALERVHTQSNTHENNDHSDHSQLKKRPPKAAAAAASIKSQRQNASQHIPSQRLRKQLEKSENWSTESRLQVAPQCRNVDVLPSLLESPKLSDTNPSLNESTVQLPKKVLIIGLGGTGAESILGLRRKIVETNPDQLHCEQLGFLLVDSDQKTIESVLDPDRSERMPYHATVLIPLNPPQYYRQNSKSDFRQLSRRWVYNIPRSLKTEGVRPLGMLAFLDNAVNVFDALQESISEIAKSSGDERFCEPVGVQIVSSAHGGTGSAIAAEIGFMIRQLAAELEIPIQVEMILTCATPNGIASTDLTTASALSCLMEINHYFETGGLHPHIDQIAESQAINQPPFDHVSLIYGGQCGNHGDWMAATVQAADYMWACSETELGSRLESTRIEANSDANHQIDQGWTNWLSAINSRHLEISSQIEPIEAASRLCLRACLPWLSALNDVIAENARDDASRNVADSKLLEKMDFFVGDMFRNNRWTAQAWVRECMVCLVPNDDRLDATAEAVETNQDRDPKQLQDVLNTEQRWDLEQVCEQLALNMQESTRTISNLITTTQDNLADWLVSRWLVSPLEWSHLKEVVRLVASKFSVNANSLNVVSQKLAANHDSSLERLYSGQQKSSPELEQRLHAMALEARFHSMGAKMLARMAEHMAYLEDLWLNECRLLQAELCTWVDDLSKRVGIRLDNSLQSNSFLSALLQTESDDSTSKAVRKSLQSIAANRLKLVLGTEQVALVDSQSRHLSFGAILEFATGSFTQPNPSTTATARTESNDADAVIASTSDGIKTSPVLEQTQSISPPTEVTAPDAIDAIILDKRSLEIEIDSTRPYFVDFGGAVRNVVLLPSLLAEQLDSIQKAAMDNRKVALVVSHRCRQAAILTVGERLVLSDIMERVWMPSSDIWNLATRLLARVDVDWLPINNACV